MALLAYWAALWLFPTRSTLFRTLLAVGFASLYGATDEVHQYFVPERSSDVLDWIADTVGALAAVPVMNWWWKRTFKRGSTVQAEAHEGQKR